MKENVINEESLSPKRSVTLRRKSSSIRRKAKKSEEDIRLIQLALHRSGFFTCLDEDQIKRFIDAAELRIFSPGEVVILQGSVDDEDSEKCMKDKLESGETTAQLMSRLTQDANDLEKLIEALREEDETSKKESTSNEESKGITGSDDDSEKNTIIEKNEPDGAVQTETTDDVSDDVEEYTTLEEEKEGNLAIYVVRSSTANIWVDGNLTRSVGPGTCFGEGAIVFNRAHSASVTANEGGDVNEGLECWVVPAKVFRSYVLKSKNMVNMFEKLAQGSKLGKAKKEGDNEEDEPFMTMDDFVKSCIDPEISSSLSSSESTRDDGAAHAIRIANTFNILRKSRGYQRINLEDFCLFHAIMARPDPEVDIAFLLMDRRRRGYISLDDFKVCSNNH